MHEPVALPQPVKTNARPCSQRVTAEFVIFDFEPGTSGVSRGSQMARVEETFDQCGGGVLHDFLRGGDTDLL